MLNRIIVSAVWLIVLAGATPALAQDPRVEVSAVFGWNFSDGVSGDAVRALDGNVYDRVDPKDSGSFGLSAGILATEHAEVGFIYARQFSTLVAGGTAETEIGDLAITTYHGYYAYNFGDPSNRVRPFLLGGMGATHFGSVDFASGGRIGTTGSETQLSFTWGGGVKVFPAPHVGLRLEGRWTPTSVKSDAAGWFCD